MPSSPGTRLRKDSWIESHASQMQPGWFSFVFSIGKPPRPRDQQMLRGILLIARPPLLLLRLRAAALALRGGDARRGITHQRNSFTSPVNRPYLEERALRESASAAARS